MSSIFLIDKARRFIEMPEQGYVSEADLQKLLADYPAVLAGDPTEDKPWRFALVTREMPVPDSDAGAGRWSMDHLFLDQDAVPTFVETKRSTDTRIRREVVGQMLDYAANGLVYWPADAIRNQFESTHNGKAAEVLERLAGPDTSADGFWNRVSDNLRAGQIRLVFVADRIPKELQRIIEFLNEQMNPAEVLGIEIRQYVADEVRTLAPHVIGQTARAQEVKSTGSRETRTWDEASFLDDLEERWGESERQTAKAIMDWVRRQEYLRCYFGHGAKDGSFQVFVTHGHYTWQPFNLWTYGRIEIAFEYNKNRPPFDVRAVRLAFLQELNNVSGIDLPEDRLDFRPSMPFSSLATAEARNGFYAAIKWFSDKARGYVDTLGSGQEAE